MLIAFLIFFSDCLLLLYSNATGFCVLTIYSATLLNWFIRSCNCVCVCVCVWNPSTYKIMSSANEDNFTYFFSILIPLVFLCLIALARPSSIMLTKSGKNWHPYHMPNLGRKLVIFHH